MFQDVDPSFYNLPTIEPSTGATGPIDHPFDPNYAQNQNRPLDHPSPPNGQNQSRPTVDLGYEKVPNRGRGVHIGIFDRLQPSGERLVELFKVKSAFGEIFYPETGQVSVNGVQHTYIKKMISPGSPIHQEIALTHQNDIGIWTTAFKRDH